MRKAEGNGKKVFGPNLLQFSENDVASSLIGGIVEKDFNKPVSAPQATVLPFPVARHRSHGPHWDPRTSNFNTHGNEDEDDYGEDEDHTDFDWVAAGADPVQRKQKKGLDFSRWRELMNDGNAAESRSKENTKIKINRKPCDFKSNDSRSSKPEVVKFSERTMSNMGINSAQSGLDVSNELAIKAKDIPESRIVEVREENMEDVEEDIPASLTSDFNSQNVGVRQGSTSIESEIDAENRARLERMSTDEISEAQAEIIHKMNPALIKMLQKRGQEKLKKKSSFVSESRSNGQVVDLQGVKESISSFPLSETKESQKVKAADSKDTQNGWEKDVPEMKSSNSTVWDAWSKKVEAARELRFSLDGDVIDDYGQVPKAGGASAQSSYSAQNASERDFIRTEGDPGAFGYSIREALALTRSVVPGQRALALHLLANVLDKAQDNILRNEIGLALKNGNLDRLVDWEALWAFALGPEPELALSLRICLDDNHNSVVLACAKVIQCVLSCDLNDHFCDISEKIAHCETDVCTAPIFRSRPNIDGGFLHGGFWKYNTKPSNILPFDKTSVGDDTEGEHTIKDDVVVAAQDIAAGLVRMGILPRIRYLLESDPSAALEECLMSILIAVARHSPTCADAIMRCERLVQVVVDRFTTKDQIGVDSPKIKSVILMKVLARYEKKRCMEFVNNGIFQKMTWHLYRYAFSPDHWLNMEREKCKLSSTLLVEQLRFWKVCIQYGHCVSYFTELLPALNVWLDIPSFGKLVERKMLHEFVVITRELYLVLEALTRTLPNFYPHDQKDVSTNNTETWCWNHVGPVIDLALKWISTETDPYLSNLLSLSEGMNTAELSSILWVISAVMDMLFGILKRVIPDDNSSFLGGQLPWIPEFVPKIGLHIIKNGLFSFPEVNRTGNINDTDQVGSFLESLCHFRRQSDHETSIASVCCLNGLAQLVVSIDKLIHLANTDISIPSSKNQNLAREDKILTDGILKWSLLEMTNVLTTFMKLISSQRRLLQSVEMFGRGGPAPGVGAGWGASGGGFWSLKILLTQMDARLVLQLLEISLVMSAKEMPTGEEFCVTVGRLNCIMDICLIMGPNDRIIVEKALDILLQPPVLKCLDFSIHRFLDFDKRLNLKTFVWQYKVEDYQIFSDVLASHFKTRWLHVKKKSEGKVKNRDVSHGTSKKSRFSLDTIKEDADTSMITTQENKPTSLVTEWARQRLPLPEHWFLSPISTVDCMKVATLSSTPNFSEVARCGLFFLLGLEAMSAHLSSDSSSCIQSVSVIWKLHSLSVTLFAGMDILGDEKSRDAFEILQEFYGKILDEKLVVIGQNRSVDLLKFDKEIHESYSTFVEALVENFSGASYGDVLYGRQIAMYLHRCVGASVRLAAWNALSNVRALELLPPLEKCLGKEEGYLEPMENDELVLEAFAKSWVSGALDRSVSRQSVAFTLAIHHLSHFIFGSSGNKMSLRNKLAKTILRDYARKPAHEGMVVNLIRYKTLATIHKQSEVEDSLLQVADIEKRFTVLREACEGNSSLLSVVEKLRTAVGKEQ